MAREWALAFPAPDQQSAKNATSNLRLSEVMLLPGRKAKAMCDISTQEWGVYVSPPDVVVEAQRFFSRPTDEP